MFAAARHVAECSTDVFVGLGDFLNRRFQHVTNGFKLTLHKIRSFNEANKLLLKLGKSKPIVFVLQQIALNVGITTMHAGGVGTFSLSHRR